MPTASVCGEFHNPIDFVSSCYNFLSHVVFIGHGFVVPLRIWWERTYVLDVTLMFHGVSEWYNVMSYVYLFFFNIKSILLYIDEKIISLLAATYFWLSDQMIHQSRVNNSKECINWSLNLRWGSKTFIAFHCTNLLGYMCISLSTWNCDTNLRYHYNGNLN